MYGMRKTTLYLPDELKSRITVVANQCGMSEAELIRETLREGLDRRARPKPQAGSFALDDPYLSERVDEHLKGFGEH